MSRNHCFRISKDLSRVGRTGTKSLLHFSRTRSVLVLRKSRSPSTISRMSNRRFCSCSACLLSCSNCFSVFGPLDLLAGLEERRVFVGSVTSGCSVVVDGEGTGVRDLGDELQLIGSVMGETLVECLRREGGSSPTLRPSDDCLLDVFVPGLSLFEVWTMTPLMPGSDHVVPSGECRGARMLSFERTLAATLNRPEQRATHGLTQSISGLVLPACNRGHMGSIICSRP